MNAPSFLLRFIQVPAVLFMSIVGFSSLRGQDAADFSLTFLPEKIILSGIPEDDLNNVHLSEARTEAFRVTVLDEHGQALTPMAGTHGIEDDTLTFTPAFPWSPGLHYRAVFEPSKLKNDVDWFDLPDVIVDYAAPPREARDPAIVTAVYPSADVLPANLLRFYVHFSQPMTRGSTYQHVELLMEDGTPMELPFLEIAEELWDRDARRLTLLLDPGRVKHGLVPHEEAGPVLEPNKTYTLRIGATFEDARGHPLAKAFEKKFRTTAPDSTRPDPSTWTIEPPLAGTKAPLTLRFPEPLDHGLLQWTITIHDAPDQQMRGDVEVLDNEASWRFTPNDAWQSGPYAVKIRTLLEDPSGNSIAHLFERISDDRKLPGRDEFQTLPFEIKQATATSGFNWPSWRGPHENGISLEQGLPTTWSTESNLAWKQKIQGTGASTPIVWGDRVLLTAQIGREPKTSGPGAGTEPGDEDLELSIQAFNRVNGRPLWDTRYPVGEARTATHAMHNYASPSPVTDGTHVWAWFGTGFLACLDLNGNTVWTRDLANDYHPFQVLWGHASSPVLDGDHLFLLCDHESAACLIALDKVTGKERWKADRGKGLRSYSCPLVIETSERRELIVNSNPSVDAYDPSSGELLWSFKEFCKVPVPMPVYSSGALYLSRGYRSGPYMALRPGGQGDITETHRLWRMASRAPYVSSLIAYNDLLYLTSEEGGVFAADPSNGEPVWVEKLGKGFWSSPVAADGRLYLQDETGETVVINAGRDFELVSRNPLGERTLASPAIAQGAIYIRGDQHLFCVRN